MTQSIQPSEATRLLPSIIGPNVYELYTDANLFITQVYVNNKKLKLSNAEGNGSMGDGGYRFSGPMGYQNKLILNGHLKAGNNEIKVVFEPSSILDDAKKEGVEEIIIRDMYAHAAITRGVLNNSSSGVESYDLDQLLSSDIDVKILENKLLRRFTVDKLSQEVNVLYQLELEASDKIEQVEFSDCSLSSNSSNNFSATLLLNDVPISEIKDNSSSRLESFSSAIKQGDNIFTLKVNSINEKKDSNYLDLYLDCDLRPSIEKISFMDEGKNLDFGDFLNSAHLALAKIKFIEAGEYCESFNIKF